MEWLWLKHNMNCRAFESRGEAAFGIFQGREGLPGLALPSSIRSMIDSGPAQAWRQGDEQLLAVDGVGGERWLRVRCTSIGRAEPANVASHCPSRP